jgi:hypothetical protein
VNYTENKCDKEILFSLILKKETLYNYKDASKRNPKSLFQLWFVSKL